MRRHMREFPKSLDAKALDHVKDAERALRKKLGRVGALDTWVDSLPRPIAHLCEEALYAAAKKPLCQVVGESERKAVVGALELLARYRGRRS